MFLRKVQNSQLNFDMFGILFCLQLAYLTKQSFNRTMRYKLHKYKILKTIIAMIKMH